MKRPAAGFTLIEILVALSLLALLGVLGYRGLDGIRYTAGELGERADRWQEIGLTLERLGNDVRQAVAVPGRDGEGRELPAWIGIRSPATPAASAQLVLTRIGRDGGDLQRVSYRWQGEHLELLTWPAFDAPAANRKHRLLAGIAGLEFAHLDRENRWQAEWPPGDRQTLPRALRVRLFLAEGGTLERIFDVAAGQ